MKWKTVKLREKSKFNKEIEGKFILSFCAFEFKMKNNQQIQNAFNAYVKHKFQQDH